MAYIGQSIKNGTFSVLDTSGNTYNGSNTTFSLGTQVGSAAQLLVSHDGVIQKPGTDYTLASGGTQITFTTAPASGASIFIVEISGAVGGPMNRDINGDELILDVDGDTSITADTDDQIDFKTGGTDRARIDSSGRIIKGHTGSITTGSRDSAIQITGTSAADSSLSMMRFNSGGGPAELIMGQSRNSTIGGNTIVQNADNVGMIQFVADDGTDYASKVAEIRCDIDVAPGANDTAGRLRFSTTADGANSTTERMRIDSSGVVNVGTTTPVAGATALSADGISGFQNQGNYSININRQTNDGALINFQRGGTTVGSINAGDNDLIIGKTDGGVQCYLRFAYSTDKIIPCTDVGGTNDNLLDLGDSGSRFDDIHATNGTIQTSDQNEKQSIQALTSTEIAVAKRISKLFKTFKWNSAVEQKGDNARTHTGIIAQDVQQAFTDEGLDASNYGMFISSTWWEKEISVDAVAEELDENGDVVVEGKDAYTYIVTKEEATEGYTEKTRLGVRYPELLSFISSAFEQRLTDIETRVTALEG